MSRRMGGRAAAVVLTGIALAAVIAVFAPSVVASGTEKAGATIYGSKADCGATGGKANQGYSHNGRATFVRNGNTLTASWTVRDLVPNVLYNVQLWGDG